MRTDITVHIAAAFIAVVLPLAEAMAEPLYYMWRDESGVLNFSQLKPDDVDARVVQKPERAFGYPDESSPTQDSSPASSESADTSVPGLSPADETGITSTSIRQSNALTMKHNCESARKVLQRLRGFKQIIMRGEDGIWREISAEAKLAEIERTLAEVREYCGG